MTVSTDKDKSRVISKEPIKLEVDAKIMQQVMYFEYLKVDDSSD